MAYAQHQQSYLAHHQSAMQQEQQMRQLAPSHEAASMHTMDSRSIDEALDPTHVAEMMKHMAHVAQMVISGQQEGSYQQVAQQAAAMQQQQQQMVPPPQLWGSDRIIYDSSDPMHQRWGIRAAPPYHRPLYEPPPDNFQITLCWSYVDQMKDDKLMIAPQHNMPPPPFVPED
ncbi:unnamed protein product [Gongylonema pulchrum]|uniref:Uncharacterized protein n=1 Tax=Gongylonema pulchrum TaxID=637853 RepID=A0A183D498_9BILA|nr:unnamed protein product [Gongylonema pulchrum]